MNKKRVPSCIKELGQTIAKLNVSGIFARSPNLLI